MIKNPHRKDHYTYLNELLDLKDKKQLGPKTEIEGELITKVKAELTKLEDMKRMQVSSEIEANIIKIKRALEILESDDKRKLYNAGLESPPTVQVKIEGVSKKCHVIVPLVPVDEIIAEFNAFKAEKTGQDKPKGGKYKENDFRHEKLDGPPVMDILVFPDIESVEAFLGSLFDKNMVMLPNGSQDIEDVKKQFIQQALKGQVSDLRSSPPEPEEEPFTSPGM